ncbi:nucleotidyltransferase family protein [soil metagenome]
MLTPAEVRTVRGIVESVLPGSRVRVFGSRATGRARPFSALDLLVVEPARLSWLQRADLRDAFEASDLPFRVDVVEAGGLAAGMAERVANESLPLRDPGA